MTIRSALKLWSTKISWQDAETLLAHVLKKDRAWLIGHGTDTLRSDKQKQFDQLARRRAKHEPLAYLVGYKHFFGRDFLVTRATLIPRPETETLVLRAREHLSHVSESTLVWDVGTGSGAIALPLATHPNILKYVRILASDKSEAALHVARKNARKMRAHVTFVKDDLLGPKIKKILTDSPAHSFLILANLPYLPDSDRRHLTSDVIKYEPPSALFAPDKGLALNKKLLSQLKAFQKIDGRPIKILMEIDPPQAKKFQNVKIVKDQFGRKRFLEIIVPAQRRRDHLS